MSHFIKNKPRGFLRWALRAPIWLYHAGLGGILGNRFLMLHYIGRKSGLPREAVIEVMRHDKESNTYYVASGWGTKSDWFQSIRTNRNVKLCVGKHQRDARAHILDFEEAANELCIYAKHHPAAFHEISRLLTGEALKGTNEECRQLARSVPVIAFRPKRS